MMYVMSDDGPDGWIAKKCRSCCLFVGGEPSNACPSPDDCATLLMGFECERGVANPSLAVKQVIALIGQCEWVKIEVIQSSAKTVYL